MMDNEELLFNELYEKTKDCGRTQFVRLLMEKDRKNQELNKKYLNAVADYETTMFEKGQLKKQLEEYLIQNINLRADIMIQKMAFPNELIKDKTFYNLYNMPSYEELLVQQKKFIKYLEDEIKQINPKILDDGELNLRLDDIKFTQYLIYKEVLQKYKEIVGGIENENND